MNHKGTKTTKDTEQDLIPDDLPEEVNRLAYTVIGAAIEVHRVLGPGYRESTYEEALCIELALRGIAHVRQPSVALRHKGRTIGEGRLDILAGDCLIVELKAVDELSPVHRAQALSYLKATGHRLGLLINFNVDILRTGVKRVVH
ncbi:MAG: GxxExxY protein [Chloroflexota bacterium]|nr:GxxExxY protein [Chloroflexota bacterium]